MIESSKFGAGAAYRDLFQAPMTPSNIINPKPKSGVYAKSGSCWRCSRLQGVGSSLSCQNNLVVSYQDKFIVSCQDIFVHTHKCVNPTVPLILLHSIYTTRQLLKAGKKRLFPGFRFQASRQKIQEIPILRRRRNLKKLFLACCGNRHEARLFWTRPIITYRCRKGHIYLTHRAWDINFLVSTMFFSSSADGVHTQQFYRFNNTLSVSEHTSPTLYIPSFNL